MRVSKQRGKATVGASASSDVMDRFEISFVIQAIMRERMKLTGILEETLLTVMAISALGQSNSAKQTFDRAEYYKKNCAEWHGSKADKKFNTDLPEQQMIDAILNGETMEAPPDMPAFADKGINEERARP